MEFLRKGGFYFFPGSHIAHIQDFKKGLTEIKA